MKSDRLEINAKKIETDKSRMKKIDSNRFKSVLIPLKIKTNSD